MTDLDQNTDPEARAPLDPLVSDSPWNVLLQEWIGRQRVMGRDNASHPMTLRRVMAKLDADGPSETGDCIQSLVFELQIARNRAERFASELTALSR